MRKFCPKFEASTGLYSHGLVVPTAIKSHTLKSLNMPTCFYPYPEDTSSSKRMSLQIVLCLAPVIGRIKPCPLEWTVSSHTQTCNYASWHSRRFLAISVKILNLEKRHYSGLYSQDQTSLHCKFLKSKNLADFTTIASGVQILLY